MDQQPRPVHDLDELQESGPPPDATAGRLSRVLLWLGVRRLLIVTDLCALSAGYLLLADPLNPTDLVFVTIMECVFLAAGLNRSRLTLSVLDDLPRLVGCGLAAAMLAEILASWTGKPAPEARTVTLVLGMVGVLRALVYWRIRQFRRSARVSHRTLVLGAGDVGVQIVQALLAHPEYGLRPVAYLDDDPKTADSDLPVPVIGPVSGLADALLSMQAGVVVVAFARGPESEVVGVIRTCARLRCAIFFVPRLFEIGVHGDLDRVWGIPLVRLRQSGHAVPSRALKRTMDVVLSSLGLVLLSPVMLLTALAVFLEVGRGVIFRQTRISVDGRPFTIYKFRSLRDSEPAQADTEWSAGGSQIGPVGRLIRATSLDELPQLWNVLRGDMSLVGPRPERPHFVDHFREAYPHYTARHRVRAGLTGYAQVHGLRGDTSIADRLRFDNAYIEDWSFWSDVKILLWTVRSVVRRAGS